MGQLVTTYTVLQALSLEYIILHDSKLFWLSAGCLLYLCVCVYIYTCSHNFGKLVSPQLVLNGMGINNLYGAPSLIFKMAISGLEPPKLEWSGYQPNPDLPLFNRTTSYDTCTMI